MYMNWCICALVLQVYLPECSLPELKCHNRTSKPE